MFILLLLLYTAIAIYTHINLQITHSNNKNNKTTRRLTQRRAARPETHRKAQRDNQSISQRFSQSHTRARREATPQRSHRGLQTLRPEVPQAWGAKNESRQHLACATYSCGTPFLQWRAKKATGFQAACQRNIAKKSLHSFILDHGQAGATANTIRGRAAHLENQVWWCSHSHRDNTRGEG